MTTGLPNGCYLATHRVLSDPRGHLLPIEAQSDVPFAIERVYFLYGAGSGVERGFHAHRSLEQRVFCVSGSCTILLDSGREHSEVRLDRPEVALHIGPMIWREIRDLSADCVIVTLASAHYDEADYIRDRGEFLAAVAEQE